MAFSEEVKRGIRAEIEGFANAVIQRRLDEPFEEADFAKRRPFHAALVPPEIWKAAKFERSFVTSQGQRGFERIGLQVALGRGTRAITNKKSVLVISQRRLTAIQTILDDLERKKKKPDWESELRSVADAGAGPTRTVEVVTDLWLRRPRGGEEFYEIKSSKPNSDQTKVSKEKMLKLMAGNPANRVFFALPDNPYLTREAYGWPYPKRWFDMSNDPCVVMGRGFWDRLGGEGTFDELLALFQEVGLKIRPRIRKELLGLD